MHYARATDTMSRARATEVLTAAAEVMRKALGEGGTSFDALYVNVNGTSGYFDRSLAVYGREGEPCPRCGTPIRREPFMNRSSYRCPRCQRAPRGLVRTAAAPVPNITQRGAHASRGAAKAGLVRSMERSAAFHLRPAWAQLALLFRFGLVGRLRRLREPAGRRDLQQARGRMRTGSSSDLPLTDFNVRWYHVYSTIAFLVANLWNFQLNRWWTFRSAKHSGWLREYLPVPRRSVCSARSSVSPS